MKRKVVVNLFFFISIILSSKIICPKFVLANNLYQDKAELLLILAEKNFEKLTEFEKKFFIYAANGDIIDYNDNKRMINNQANENRFIQNNPLKATHIAWLCNDTEASQLVNKNGLRINGAHIVGDLDVKFAVIPFRIFIINSLFDGNINLTAATLKNLVLSGSSTKKIDAQALVVDESILLNNGFKSKEGVNLFDSKIKGHLDCSGSKFLSNNITNKGAAVDLGTATVNGTVIFSDGFEAHGQVSLSQAYIGNLICNGGRFFNEKSVSINAVGLTVNNYISLTKGFKSEGSVNFFEAKIGGSLIAEGKSSTITSYENIALMLDGIETIKSIYIGRGFEVHGEVSMSGAKIGGTLSFDGGLFKNNGKVAIYAADLIVDHLVTFSKGFKSEGLVTLLDSKIGSQLHCNGAFFSNKKGMALAADGIIASGSVHFSNGFKAEGEVRILDGKIGGSLNCNGGYFINPGAISINARDVQIDKSVFLTEGFLSEGEVKFNGARINGTFNYADIKSPETITLNLRNAIIRQMNDNPNSWPINGRLLLDGLIYDSIDQDNAIDVVSRIYWINLQPKSPFKPQPYEQLAKVLRSSGRNDESVDILIQKNKDFADFNELSLFQKVWYHCILPLIGYGYRMGSLFYFVLFFVFIGWIFFRIGGKTNIMMPTLNGPKIGGLKPTFITPNFSEMLYSIDAFIPIIDLQQAKYWLPSTEINKEILLFKRRKIKIKGKWLYLYLCWIHIPAGWFSAAIFAAWLSGLIKT